MTTTYHLVEAPRKRRRRRVTAGRVLAAVVLVPVAVGVVFAVVPSAPAAPRVPAAHVQVTPGPSWAPHAPRPASSHTVGRTVARIAARHVVRVPYVFRPRIFRRRYLFRRY